MRKGDTSIMHMGNNILAVAAEAGIDEKMVPSGQPVNMQRIYQRKKPLKY